MKKIYFIFAVVASFGLLASPSRAAWIEPTDTAPDGNAPAPLNVSSAAQTKDGALLINGAIQSVVGFISGDTTQGYGQAVYNAKLGNSAIKLGVGGKVMIVDGTQGLGKVLTSDATGLASWQDPSGGSGGYWALTGNNITNANTGTVTVKQPTTFAVNDWSTYGLLLKQGATPTQALGLGADATNAYIQSWNQKPLVINGQGNNVGIGIAPASSLSVYNGGESATLADFTQALASAGLNVATDYTVGTYLPGLFWSTSNNNPTKPKAGIWLYGDSAGTDMYFGTSNAYATGITNNGLVIDQAGKVGVGTTTPNALLTVQGPGTGIIQAGQWVGGSQYAGYYMNGDFSINTNYNFLSSPSDKHLYINRPSNVDIHFREANNADQMIIKSGGNVGIGQSTPGAKLDVNGTTQATGFKIAPTNCTDGQVLKWSGGVGVCGTDNSSGTPTWASITGIPAGFADGIDDTGSAPTWASITGKPAGFADGVDDTGITTIIPGAGISATGATEITVSNTGVTKIIPGTNISVSPPAGTGNVTVSATTPSLSCNNQPSTINSGGYWVAVCLTGYQATGGGGVCFGNLQFSGPSEMSQAGGPDPINNGWKIGCSDYTGSPQAFVRCCKVQ